MKKLLSRAGAFFRVFGGCVSDAWKDSDCHYHIPKSRFNGNYGGEGAELPSSPRRKAPPTNYFLGSFRDCLLTAWKVSDNEYHIPKSRFLDPEYNRNAYRSSTDPGLLSKMSTFLWTLKSCIAMSWEASDIFYHLPKSRYQEAEFIRELMKLAPEPEGKLLYRPYMIGHGFVVGEAEGKGWRVPIPDESLKNVFIAPEMIPGADYKPELGK